MDKQALLESAAQSIIEADDERAMEIIAEAEAGGMDLMELLSSGFSAGMREVGDMFDTGEVFLPELMVTSDVMKEVADVIESKLDKSQIKSMGKIVIGTVQGDVHDIGKGIVAALLKTNGMEVYDLGREVPAEDFVAKAKEVDADFIGSSALLTTTMTVQKDIVDLLEGEGLKGKFKTIVGGAPVTKRWADKIGADGYCEDATEAVAYMNDYYSK